MRFEIGAGEAHKTLSTVESLTRGFAGIGLTRNDVVIARRRRDGHRRRRVRRRDVAPRRRRRARGHDAARDGRRRDRREDRRQPAGGQEPRRRVLAAVRCALRPRCAGHAAAAASGAPATARWPSTTSSPATTSTPWTSRIASPAASQIKADVVAADEREGGRRALLNYGHTLAHALEIATGHELTHGEAVGIGLVYAAELARILGRIDDRPRRRAPRGRRRHVRAADERCPPAIAAGRAAGADGAATRRRSTG